MPLGMTGTPPGASSPSSNYRRLGPGLEGNPDRLTATQGLANLSESEL